jgi:PAS domain S-box-containing protein
LGIRDIARIEHQLAIAQQIAHVGSWEWDLATGAVTWSDELFRIYGLMPGEVRITKDFFMSRVHPRDRQIIEEKIAAALRAGGRFEWVERVVRPDGSIRELETIGEVQCDEGGEPTALIGTCRDVTEERAASERVRMYADLVHHVQIGLSVWSGEEDGLPCRLLAFNPACERIARMSLARFIGKPLVEIIPYARDGQLANLLTRVAQDRCVYETGVDRSRDPDDPTRALWMKGFPLPGGCVGIAIEDVTARTIEGRLRAAEHRVLEMIAAGASLADSLTALVMAIEENSPPVMGSVLLLEADGVHVRHLAGPRLPESYRRGIDGTTIGPRAGSCGTAAFMKTPIFVVDIEQDALWAPYRDLALAHGLHACWSIPILATDRRVLGTFAFYYREPRAPAPRDLEVAGRAAHLAGIAIERKQAEEQLRELPAHVEAALEEERTGIAREIHDELGQALTALKMDIEWILRRGAAVFDAASADGIVDRLRGMSSLTDQTIGQVRRISAELRPGVLDDLGLIAAIEWQGQEFEQRTGLTCVVACDAADIPLDRQVSTAVFRIFQEALTNVTRHARADHVEVRVEIKGATLRLWVRDDGVGITAEAANSRRSLGLLGVRERARRLGGWVTIGPAQPRGTLLDLQIPLQPPGGAP